MSVPEKQLVGLIEIKILLNKSLNRLPNPDLGPRIVRFENSDVIVNTVRKLFGSAFQVTVIPSAPHYNCDNQAVFNLLWLQSGWKYAYIFIEMIRGCLLCLTGDWDNYLKQNF